MNKDSIWQHHEDVLRESAVTMSKLLQRNTWLKRSQS